MKILCHRGYWKEPNEKNSIAAFRRSLEFDFGLETDIRDCAYRLLVSHDIPKGSEADISQVLKMFHKKNLPLALNIKSDGLAASLKIALSAYDIKDWFVFDMSIPDMRNYLDENIPVFARFSEVEKEPPWIDEVAGIWFDSFLGDSYDISRIAKYLHNGKRVCIVSPELHGRPHEPIWMAIKSLSEEVKLMLCTDYPEQAREFFMEK